MTLVATLTDYPPAQNPTVTSKTAEGPLDFNNPCDAPFDFVATAQDATTPDNYSGTAIVT
jgi:hypothetical protein